MGRRDIAPWRTVGLGVTALVLWTCGGTGEPPRGTAQFVPVAQPTAPAAVTVDAPPGKRAEPPGDAGTVEAATVSDPSADEGTAAHAIPDSPFSDKPPTPSHGCNVYIYVLDRCIDSAKVTTAQREAFQRTQRAIVDEVERNKGNPKALEALGWRCHGKAEQLNDNPLCDGP